MGRPARHDRDRLLDAAVDLAFEAGPAGVTVAAVARAAGAPSGSVYHRFPSAAALLAAVWLRALERFQDGFVAAATSGPADRAALDAARHVVSWSRAHPREALVLQYGPRDFGQAEWPDADKDRLARGNRRVREALDALATRLAALPAAHPTGHPAPPAGRHGLPPDPGRVVLAVVDVPQSVVARHLREGTPIPASADDLVAETAAVLLGIRPVN
ncbi:TetR family transcriptional regulator [Actinomadura harenae]|uniref:TetR family transcriptional regulator n=1 Tax=Actinomadura harenae TaxID=2483351 RepID=A0A3M2LL12_9ACTN|nr:TetR family transcriptional regulator [Actinomadura harenae]RMI37223.1 TetR family transcriptional regulator [Actinomadura harenae]